MLSTNNIMIRWFLKSNNRWSKHSIVYLTAYKKTGYENILNFVQIQIISTFYILLQKQGRDECIALTFNKQPANFRLEKLGPFSKSANEQKKIMDCIYSSKKKKISTLEN